MTDRENKIRLTHTRDSMKRLSYEVHSILRRANQDFRDPYEHEEHFDVDAVLSGKMPMSRTANRNYSVSGNRVPSAGSLIPHANLFNSIVRAHA